MEKIISVFDKVRAYAYNNKLKYEFDFQPETLMFRVGYWERVDSKFESFLKSIGFKIDVFDDEDCGRLHSYKYTPPKEQWFEAVASEGNTVHVKLHYMPELDEQYGDDIIMIDKNGKEYLSQTLLIIKEL